jgi:Cu(I)/Ag(I) efflux system membrane fusion protein
MSHRVEHGVDTPTPESPAGSGPAENTGTWRSRILGSYQRMSPRARRIAVASAVGVVTLGGVVWAVASRDKGEPTAPARGMAGMENMPGMGMTEGGSVRLTSAQIHQFGITFGTVELRPLTTEVRTTGVVTFNETRTAQVAPKFGGFVERLYVNFTGQPVRRGQPLMEVYSPDLVAAQQELLLAGQLQRDIGRSAVPGVPANTTNLVEAARRRLRLWDVSEGQIDEILRTGRVSRTLTLYAPASGVVAEKRAVQGQSFMPGEHLYTIVDLSDVWVDVQIREMDAAAVRVGSGADVEFAGLPARTFKGFVTYVYPTLDTAARAVRARVSVTNTDNVLKPGMYATVRLYTPKRTALTVPSSAVLRTGERNVVFVDMGGGELMPHDVQLGRTAGEYTEVLSGVEPGQRVVTSAQFLLDSESNLAEVMRSMMGQMGPGGTKSMEGMRDMPGMDMPGMEIKGKGADMKNMPGMAPRPPAAPPRR